MFSTVLGLFRRPTDPKEYFELYTIPIGLVLAGLVGAALLAADNLGTMAGAVSIASAISCIVSNQ